MTPEQIELRTQQITSAQLGDLVIACARLRAENEAKAEAIQQLTAEKAALQLNLDNLKCPPESS